MLWKWRRLVLYLAHDLNMPGIFTVYPIDSGLMIEYPEMITFGSIQGVDNKCLKLTQHIFGSSVLVPTLSFKRWPMFYKWKTIKGGIKAVIHGRVVCLVLLRLAMRKD